MNVRIHNTLAAHKKPLERLTRGSINKPSTRVFKTWLARRRTPHIRHRVSSCLSRSTFLGGQRFCSYLWSGDTTATFPTLTQQITAGVSAGGSGLSSWTLDLGGFSGLNINDTNDQELFVRWFSMGTFLPYMRVHGDRQCSIPPNNSIPFGNNCPNEPWAFDNTGDANFLILNSYINLRYQIMPYTKRVFQILQSTGRTIMRALYYDFSVSDPFVVNATAVNDPLVVFQFMFGPRILVAPVAELGATSKMVYLPKLTGSMIAQNFTWTHWWSNATFGTGGMSINISAPLSQIPLFYLGTKDDIFAGNVWVLEEQGALKVNHNHFSNTIPKDVFYYSAFVFKRILHRDDNSRYRNFQTSSKTVQ